MLSQSCSELEELIRILHDRDRSGANAELSEDEYVIKTMDLLLTEDLEVIKQVVRWLEDDFNNKAVKYVYLKPSISMMIAYASCKLENQQQTLYYAKVATEQFRLYPNLWNQALAFWFLGIIYRYNDHFDETKNALKTAKELLEKHATEAHRKNNFRTRDLCYEYMRRIEQSINDLSPHTVFSRSLPENKETKSLPSGFLDRFRQASSLTTTRPYPTPKKKTSLTKAGSRLRQKNNGNETSLPNRPLQVFLCHSSNDKPAVRELYQKLRAEAWIEPWLDEEELYPGQDWNMEIEKAVEAADAIIVCLSKGSITKEGYVQRELRIVLDFADYKPEGTLYIMPVRLEECEPPRRLRPWQYADYFEGQRDRAFQRLLVSLKRRADELELRLQESALDEEKLEKKEPQKSPSSDARFLKCGVLTLDLHTRYVTMNGRMVNLPPTSFDYLLVLARHTPNVVDYETLVTEAQGYETNIRDVQGLSKWHIHHIRQAIEPDVRNPIYVINVRGTGYRLVIS